MASTTFNARFASVLPVKAGRSSVSDASIPWSTSQSSTLLVRSAICAW